MRIEPIEHSYFNWLCSHVQKRLAISTPSLTHYRLLKQLHQTEYVWLIVGDDNRVEDGVELRLSFLDDTNVEIEQEWFYSGCSVLEMLIAFSKRAEFNTELDSYFWFWHFLENLNLSEYNDCNDYDFDIVNTILNRFIYREYEPEGFGGLFPMLNPKKDQTKVEIWYQFFEYLNDEDFKNNYM